MPDSDIDLGRQSRRDKRRYLTVRQAFDFEGREIRDMIVASAAFFGGASIIEEDYVDWAKIEPWWIVAIMDGAMVGAVQTCLALPDGRLEFLATSPGLAAPAKPRVVRSLLVHGFEILRRGGASMVMGTIPDDMPEYRDILKRRGGIETCHGVVIARRLV